MVFHTFDVRKTVNLFIGKAPLPIKRYKNSNYIIETDF